MLAADLDPADPMLEVLDEIRPRATAPRLSLASS
jgi:hypothetical protein